MAKHKRSHEEKRNQAYDLYMNTDKTQREIAKIVGVGEDTISDWIRNKKWREEKAAYSVTKEKVIANNLVQILNLQEAINKRDEKWATPAEMQTMNMYSKVIESLSGRVSLPNYITVVSEFLKFIHKANPDMAKKVADCTSEFIQTKARELTR